MRSIAIAAVAFFVGAAVPLRAQTLPRAEAELDSLVAARMADAGIMGVAAAVIVDDEVAWSKGYGFADYARTRPFTPDTTMYVASIGKTFTGVAMMRAVALGRLSLDADINAYLPFRVVNPRHPDAPITLRQLATHTSGITDRLEVYRGVYRYGAQPVVPLGDFLADYFVITGTQYAAENFLDARPGELREYSNVGAALAGFIIERAFDEPLPAYLRREIFAPLQMTNTASRWSEAESTLFAAQEGIAVPIQPYEITTYPDSGIRTSVSDLSRFFIALLDGGAYRGTRILSPEMAAEMTRFQFSSSNRPKNFPAEEGNSGLFWRTKFNGTRVGHGGNDPGMAAEMEADLDDELGIILFSNTSLSGPDRRAFVEILNALWTYAESLRGAD